MPKTTCIKRSITLPKELDQFIQQKAKKVAAERGGSAPNFSAALADIVIDARKLAISKSSES